jgi:hypothetical protein
MPKEEAKPVARRHHYVPRFYLRGFCNGDGLLFVVDAKTKKEFTTAPENVAAEKDFNRIDIEGVPPDAVEKAFANFEGEVAPALERIAKVGSFKDKNDRLLVLNLITLLAIRNPRKRESIGNFQGELFKKMLALTYQTRERWESQVRQMKAEGCLPEGMDTDYETLKEFVKKGDFKIKMNRTTDIKMEIELIDDLLPFFVNRKWSLWKARNDSGGFVTSDHPVCLRWSEKEDAKGFYPPGYGMTNTDVLFPLTTDLALIGRFEGEETELTAGLFTVASYNANIIGLAQRQIYARDNAYFYLRMFPEPLGRGATLLKDPKLKNLDIEED